MKLLHEATLRVFIKQGDDHERVRAALFSLLPFPATEKGVLVRESHATTFEEKRMTILELILAKERHTTAFIAHLKALLGKDQCAELLEAHDRLHDDLAFYFRLDREKLLNGIVALTDGGDCVHCRFSLAAYPKSRAAAENVLKLVFQ